MQPNFVGQITQSEATAAQRTFTFFAPDVTDGFTPEVTLDYENVATDVQVSKNGGAFANATGVVTEVAVGVYKYVAAAAELDTIGSVIWKFVDAAARTVFAQAQVIALDLNTAPLVVSVGGIANDAITAASIAAGALGQDETRTRTESRTVSGLTTDLDVAAVGMLNAIDVVVTATGTWGGATLTIETCDNPGAAVPVWVATGETSTANESTKIAGGHAAVRGIISNDGVTTNINVTFLVRYAI